jgi:hypothetical protein
MAEVRGRVGVSQGNSHLTQAWTREWAKPAAGSEPRAAKFYCSMEGSLWQLQLEQLQEPRRRQDLDALPIL